MALHNTGYGSPRNSEAEYRKQMKRYTSFPTFCTIKLLNSGCIQTEEFKKRFNMLQEEKSASTFMKKETASGSGGL